jgi:hypothetical protein
MATPGARGEVGAATAALQARAGSREQRALHVPPQRTLCLLFAA